MQTFTFAAATVAAFAGAATAQGVAAGSLVPSGANPSGCSGDYSGNFEITVVKPTTAKRSLSERAAGTCSSNDTLIASLTGGILTDAKGRIGGIVANGQFQFDGPPSQTGTIYNGGFAVCGNGSLALGPSTVFYQCLSGDFYNLYDVSTGEQCSEVVIDVIPCSGSTAAATGVAAVTQTADGQVAGPAATQINDGQIQAASAIPVSQIADGQIQIPTATPVAQIGDGQLQATTAAPAAAVTQIGDGQVQAASATPVAQIADGQVQAATATPVAQIADGQVQATNATTTATPYTGAAAQLAASSFGLAAAAVVAFFL